MFYLCYLEGEIFSYERYRLSFTNVTIFREEHLVFARLKVLDLSDVVTCSGHVRAILLFFLLTRCNRSVCHIPNILRLSYRHGNGGENHIVHSAFIYLNAGINNTSHPLEAFSLSSRGQVM